MPAPGTTFTVISSGGSLTGTRLKLISQNDAESSPFKEVLVSENVLLQYVQMNMRTERKRVDFGAWASGALTINSSLYNIKLYDATKPGNLPVLIFDKTLDADKEAAELQRKAAEAKTKAEAAKAAAK